MNWVNVRGLVVSTGCPSGFASLREINKKVRVVFVESAASLLREMITPTNFVTQDSDYYCVRNGQEINGLYIIGQHTFEVKDHRVLFEGCFVCEPCFSNRVIVPQHLCRSHKAGASREGHLARDFEGRKFDCHMHENETRQKYRIAQSFNAENDTFCKKMVSDSEDIARDIIDKIRPSWCPYCDHQLELRSAISKHNERWCPYCAGRVCGQEDCLRCAPCCRVHKSENQRMVKGYFITKEGHLCRECFLLSSQGSPGIRARISLEVYLLADLQRISNEERWLEPSVWDCSTLSGLAYNPGMIWAFDGLGNMFSRVGSCVLNKIAHVIIVVLLEVGLDRNVPHLQSLAGENKEKEIRLAFPSIPVDIMYVVAAAVTNPAAHLEDKIFSESHDFFEFEVVESRRLAWMTRVACVQSNLCRMYNAKIGESLYIGY